LFNPVVGFKGTMYPVEVSSAVISHGATCLHMEGPND